MFFLSFVCYLNLKNFEPFYRKKITLPKTHAGEHRFMWNAVEYSSGIYLIRLESGTEVQIRKAVLIR
ncbi:MAG: hypothetical protein DRP86_02350 [Candidatus Neomarinimicrobiota bacterium]|nr:MAG: hypothetical protein DRP86_02350 [Candidatus Neomarinimicrobiota bacterium]